MKIADSIRILPIADIRYAERTGKQIYYYLTDDNIITGITFNGLFAWSKRLGPSCLDSLRIHHPFHDNRPLPGALYKTADKHSYALPARHRHHHRLPFHRKFALSGAVLLIVYYAIFQYLWLQHRYEMEEQNDTFLKLQIENIKKQTKDTERKAEAVKNVRRDIRQMLSTVAMLANEGNTEAIRAERSGIQVERRLSFRKLFPSTRPSLASALPTPWKMPYTPVRGFRKMSENRHPVHP